MDYRKWKTIPLPPRMQEMEKDKRGFPVPYIVVRDIHGVPNFAVNDDRKVEYAIEHDLCAVCGQKMGEHDRWLVGGPLSAFHPNGAYLDTPTHGECLHYALKVCPYLALKKYLAGIDLEKLSEKDFPEALIFQNPSHDDDRVPFFVAIRVKEIYITRPRPGERYIHPRRDYQEVEYWLGGEKIDEKTAAELFAEHQKNPQKGRK